MRHRILSTTTLYKTLHFVLFLDCVVKIVQKNLILTTQIANMAPKLAHVNMMTDTIVANLPPEVLRSIIRSLLASQPGFTKAFEENTKAYFQSSSLGYLDQISRTRLLAVQPRIRCMLGCGLCYESLPMLDLIVESANIVADDGRFLQSIDADIVQAATAVQKAPPVSKIEKNVLSQFYDTLTASFSEYSSKNKEFPFERGLIAVANLLGCSAPIFQTNTFTSDIDSNLPPAETFQLGNRRLPRLFSGLWQLSSPAWGAASISKILQQFSQYTHSGLTAFDMADHYGDAEIIFVRPVFFFPLFLGRALLIWLKVGSLSIFLSLS